MSARRMAAFVAVALLTGLLPLWISAGSVAELDVHARPWRTHSGRLTERAPVGQAFEVTADGLHRIEVGLIQVRRPARGGVRLVLFEEGVDAPLRSVDRTPGELVEDGEWVTFDFEPVESSAGRRYRFTLEPIGVVKPGDYSAALRIRGGIGHEGAWGWREHVGPRIEGRVRHVYAPGERERTDPDGDVKADEVPHANLRALAFAARGVAARVGSVKLELWEEGASGPPLRTVELAPEEEVQNGWVVFGFEPIRASRWKRYRYALTLHAGAVLLGDDEGPSIRSFHGLDGEDERLLGMTLGELERPDRDLIFRAWCAPDRGVSLARIAARAGGALATSVAAWLAAMIVLAFALAPRSKPAGSEPASSAS